MSSPHAPTLPEGESFRVWVQSLRDLRTNFARVPHPPQDARKHPPRPSPRLVGAGGFAVLPHCQSAPSTNQPLEDVKELSASYDALESAMQQDEMPSKRSSKTRSSRSSGTDRRPKPIDTDELGDTMDRFWQAYSHKAPNIWRPDLCMPASKPLSPSSSTWSVRSSPTAHPISPAANLPRLHGFLGVWAGEVSALLAKPKASEPFSLQNHFRPGFELVCDGAGEIVPKARAALETEAGLAGRIRLKKLLHSGQTALAKHVALGLPKIAPKKHRQHRSSRRIDPPAPFSHRADEEEHREVKLALKAMVSQRRELAEARKNLAKIVSTRSRRYAARRPGIMTSVTSVFAGAEQGRELTDTELDAAELKEQQRLAQKKATAAFLKSSMGISSSAPLPASPT